MHLLDGISSDRPVICGHRGHSVGAPENTLPALEQAHAHGARLCEIDVRRTADRTFVLMHDRTIDRTTNGHGLVAHLSDAAIASLDAGSWFGPEFAGTRVPTLAQTLTTARALDLGLVLEIKDTDADDGWLMDVADEVERHAMTEAVLFSSFDHHQLLHLKTLRPAVRTLGIAHVRTVDVAALARAAELDALVLEFHLHDVPDAEAVLAAGLRPVFSLPRPAHLDAMAAFGGTDDKKARALIEAGLVSIFVVDDVAWLKAQMP